MEAEEAITPAAEYSPELPEPIIHRIQSLLPSLKKCAQTSLLSKSWRVAWSTHPTLDLDESDFPPYNSYPSRSSYPRIDKFPIFAQKTFRTYEENKTTIHTFRLRLISYDPVYTRNGLATVWTQKALKLGASDFTFENIDQDTPVLIDAFSGCQSVSRLCLHGSTIYRLKVFALPGLKSLTLTKLKITRGSFFNLISCCPLIENFSLSDINNKYYNDDYDYDYDSQSSSSDESSDDDDEQQQQEEQPLRSAPSTFFLHKLRSLVLCRVSPRFQIKPLFLDGLSSKFPVLKDLTLNLCSANVDYFRKQRDAQIISSRSLEVVSFSMSCGEKKKKDDDDEKKKTPRFEFDVPSIREFTLDCTSYMPNLCFTSKSMGQFESRVSLTQHGPLSNKWFRQLSKLLTELRGSKIHLFLHVDNNSSFHYRHEKIKCLNLCELENLTMNTEGFPFLSFKALLDGLFRISRPKMITQYIDPDDDDDDDDDEEEEEEEEEAEADAEEEGMPNDDDEEMSDDDDDDDDDDSTDNDVVLCQELIEGMKEKSSLVPSHHMYGLRDVEELSAQMLLDGLWRPQTLDSMLDDSTKKGRYRFQLKWKPATVAPLT